MPTDCGTRRNTYWKHKRCWFRCLLPTLIMGAILRTDECKSALEPNIEKLTVRFQIHINTNISCLCHRLAVISISNYGPRIRPCLLGIRVGLSGLKNGTNRNLNLAFLFDFNTHNSRAMLDRSGTYTVYNFIIDSKHIAVALWYLFIDRKAHHLMGLCEAL